MLWSLLLPYWAQAINAETVVINRIPTFIMADTSYERFGNYCRNDSAFIFLLGWQDGYGWRKGSSGQYPNGESPSITGYRQDKGPINTILGNYDALDYLYRGKSNEESFYPYLKHLTVAEHPIRFVLAPPARDAAPPKGTAGWDSLSAGFIRHIRNLQSIYGNELDAILFGWDTVDEPDTAGKKGWYPDTVRKFNRMLRAAEDACRLEDRKIVMNIQWGAAGNRWTFGEYGRLDTINIVSTNSYPIHYSMPCFFVQDGMQTEDIRFYGRHLSALVDSIEDKKPVIAVLQGHGPLNYTGMAGKDTLLNVRRVPSYAEYRFMVFDAVVRGVAGIWFWAARKAYYPPISTGVLDTYGKIYKNAGDYDEDGSLSGRIEKNGKEDERRIFNDVRLVISELEPLTRIMIQGSYVDNVVSLVSGTSARIGCTFIQDKEAEDSSFILIAVNRDFINSSSPSVTETFMLADSIIFNGYNAVVVQDAFRYDPCLHYPDLDTLPTRHITPEFRPNGRLKSFTDSFRPGEVHVYRIK